MTDETIMESDNFTGTTEEPVHVATGVSVFLGVLLAILSVVTLLGNIGTIWAFRSNVLLRQKPSNLLILSLSCCDLMVGATGLPVASIHTGLGSWPLGKPICIIVAFFSVIGVSAAMYTVTAISLDRWLLVSSEYSAYLRIQSSRNVKLQIAAAWGVAILISSCESILWIADFTSEDEASIHYTSECRSPVRRDDLFVNVIFVLLFAIPFFVMVVSTCRFAFLLRRRLHRPRTRGPGASTKSPSNNVVNQAELSSTTSEQSGHQNKIFAIEAKDATKASSSTAVTSLSSNPDSSSNKASNAAPKLPAAKHPSLSQTGRNKSFFGLGMNASRGASRNNRAQKMKNRYIKPAVRLAILLGVFALCTLPYPLFLLLTKQSMEVPVFVEARNHLSNLLLSNSGLNPFLYAIMHRKIRLFYTSKLTSPCCNRRSRSM